MKNKKLNQMLTPVLIGTAVIGVGALIGQSVNEYFYEVAIRRRRRERLREDVVSDEVGGRTENIQKAREWFGKMEAEDVIVHSFDNTKIHAKRLMQRQSHATWVLLVHGYGANHRDMLDIAKKFYERGYNLLLVDNRGHGLSSGKYIGFGWHDRMDILCWINYLTVIDEQCKIILYGMSMGASAVMNATGEELPENVKCCIEDCGFSSIQSILMHQLNRHYSKLPKSVKKLAIMNLNRLTKTRCNFSVFEGDCTKQLAKSNTPTMFIHGELDEVVPFAMVFDNYYACSAPKELYTIPETGHAEACLKSSYYDRLYRFIDRYC